MGKRGPAPTPKVILKARGSWRGDLNPSEPIAEAGAVCPEWLDDNAKIEWARIAPVLVQMGLLGKSDAAALACYCQSISIAKRANELIAEEGEVIDGAMGGKVIHPAVGMRDKAMTQIQKFGAEFGLTPSARARVQASEKKPEKKPIPSGPPMLKIAR